MTLVNTRVVVVIVVVVMVFVVVMDFYLSLTFFSQSTARLCFILFVGDGEQGSYPHREPGTRARRGVHLYNRERGGQGVTCHQAGRGR